jgi:hypothetical protein
MAKIQDLLRSHDELRAALIIAGKRIRQLQFGRKGDSVLVKLLLASHTAVCRFLMGQSVFRSNGQTKLRCGRFCCVAVPHESR